jgi:NAD(P)-dependent dehydrogenase (short-subunit alcohol dehydrogenase family)
MLQESNMSRSEQTIIIAGASRGLGEALCRRFRDAGHRVCAWGRGEELQHVSTSVPGLTVRELALDDESEVERAFFDTERQHGTASAVIYNAAYLALGSALQLDSATFERSFRTNCLGAFIVAQRALPAMVAAGSGALIFTGATASVRASAQGAAFASSKFALRGLVQALAREFGPRGIHVAHVIIDGLLWSPRTRMRFPTRDERSCIQPDDAAEVYAQLLAQPRSAWTHELDLRPDQERF